LGHIDQHRSRIETLSEQGSDVWVSLQQSGGATAIPEEQCRDLISRFSDMAAHLEHAACAIATRRGRDVVDGDLSEVAVEGERPTVGKPLHLVRERAQPARVVLVVTDELGREV